MMPVDTARPAMGRVRPRSGSFLAALFLFAIAAVTATGPATADVSDRWGAIAYGPSGVYGTARLLRTRSEAATVARDRYLERASARALRDCKSKDTKCTVRADGKQMCNAGFAPEDGHIRVYLYAMS